MKAAQEEDTKGLKRKTQMPIYRKLHALVYDKKEKLTGDEIKYLIIWTKQIYSLLKTDLVLIGFWSNPANVARLRGEISNYMAEAGTAIPTAFKKRGEIAQEILAWGKKRTHYFSNHLRRRLSMDITYLKRVTFKY